MNVTISIGQPVLIAGQYFRVRYRLVNSGSWTTAPNQTNAPFTLNLDAGNYEFEFTLIKGSPAEECPPVYKLFTVNDTNECIEFTAVITFHDLSDSPAAEKSYYTLDISYIDTADACIYTLEYGPVGGTMQQVQYSTLPASPIIIPIPQNVPYHVVLMACDCERNCNICFEEDVPAADEPDCTPGSYGATCVYYADRRNPNWFPGGYVQVGIVTPPVPAPGTFTVMYQQMDLSGGTSTGLPDSGTRVFNYVAGQTLYQITPINPNVSFLGPLQGNSRDMRYLVTVIDPCGRSVLHEFGGGTYWYA